MYWPIGVECGWKSCMGQQLVDPYYIISKLVTKERKRVSGAQNTIHKSEIRRRFYLVIKICVRKKLTKES